jgi:hypothetical protein
LLAQALQDVKQEAQEKDGERRLAQEQVTS